jgi:glutathione S-transferase
VITAVVAVDYVRLRFRDAPWVAPIPKLDVLRDATAARPAFALTLPHI